MNRNHSIKYLINRGLIIVYLPLLVFLTTALVFSICSKRGLIAQNIPTEIMLLVLIVGILLCWMWWSYKIVKWKIWAFFQIDVGQSRALCDQAIKVGLIWQKGSIFNKTEYWTLEDKTKWDELNPKIKAIFDS